LIYQNQQAMTFTNKTAEIIYLTGLIIVLLVIIILSGCAARRDLVYFSNLNANGSVPESVQMDARISSGDILDVSVSSASLESNKLFLTVNNISYVQSTFNGYTVSKEGTIIMPLIGEIGVEGMTIDQAQMFITKQLSKQIRDPKVAVRLVNFKVTVIGEVNKPASFTINSDKINVLEALGMAGDMTVYGRRQDVLVIRQENGIKSIGKLDLNNIETVKSPYFYLKQNDIVYVAPDRSKAVEYSQNTRMMPLITASISALAVLAAVLLKR